MSNEVENRVVSMTFDNSKFASRMEETLRGLKKLQESLKMTESVKGMKNVAADINKIDTAKPVGMMDRLRGAIDRIKSSHADLNLDKTVQFDSNKTVGGLTRVKEALGSLSSANAKVDLTPIGDQADGISAKFVAMAAVVGGVIGGLAAQAVSLGGRFASSFFGPIKDGFGEFETNMGSIQTILANTDRYGTTLPQVTANLDELNAYSDKTIYNFGEMVKNIGLFTNAGIRIEDATSMIKGFSNAAAASGTTSEGAAGAAYQLSQALSNGTVRLMDWKSLTNVGMGNKNMQQGIIEIADSMGTLEQAGVSSGDVTAHFNETLEKGWLSADVMSNYLKIMSGDMDRAEMATLGLSSAQIDWFERQQNIAEDAATKVRTFTQLVGTVKESIGSGWSETFRNIVGTFDEGTALFTGINSAIGKIVSNSAEARNNLLEGWKAFGGRTALIDAMKNVWQSLVSSMNAVRFAFRSIFPRQSVAGLLEMTASFKKFTETLKPSQGTIVKLVKIFGGFFSILKIGWEVLKGVAHVFGALFKAFGGAGDSVGVLQLFANFMMLIINLQKGLTESGAIEKFFDGVASAVGGAAKVIQPAAKFIFGLLGGVVRSILNLGGSVKSVIGGLKAFWAGFNNPLALLVEGSSDFAKWGAVVHNELVKITSKVKTFASGVLELYNILFKDDFTGKGPWEEDAPFLKGFFDFRQKLEDGYSKIQAMTTKIKDALSGAFDLPEFSTDPAGVKAFADAIFDGIKNTIVGHDWVGSIKQAGLDLFRGFMESIDAHSPSRMFAEGAESIPQGIGQGIKNGWNAVKDAFSWIGDKLHELFGGIGDAIASDNFTKLFSMGAIAAALKIINDFSSTVKDLKDMKNEVFQQVMDTIDEFGDTLKAFQLKLKAEALKAIAVAVALLTVSMIALTLVDQTKLAGAGAAMAGALTGITAAFVVLQKSGGTGRKMVAMALGIALIAGGMFLLAFAVAKFGGMDLKTIAQGLGAIGAAMAGFAGVFLFIGSQNENIAKAGFAILLMSGAMWVMAAAVEKMGKIDFGTMIKGLFGVGVAMGIMVLSMRAMSKKDMTKAGFGMLLLAFSLKSLANAVAIFGAIPFGELVKGLFGLSLALAAVVVAMRAMPEDMVSKAAGFGIMALALLGMAVVIKMLAGLKMGDLAKGMIAMALAIAVLVIAANAMSAGIQGAAAMLVMAFAVKMLADAIEDLSKLSWGEIAKGIGAVAAAMLVIGLLAAAGGFISPFIAAFGAAMILVGLGFLLFGTGVLQAARAIAILSKQGKGGMSAFQQVMEDIAKALPRIMAALAEGFLEGLVIILKGMGPVIDEIGNVLIKIIDKIIEITPHIFELIGVLLDGILTLIMERGPQYIETLGVLFGTFLTVLTGLLPQIATFAVALILTLVNTLTANAFNLATAAVNLLTAFLGVLQMYVPVIVSAGMSLLVALINGIGMQIGSLVTAVGNLIVTFLTTLASNLGQIITAGTDLLIAFVNGISNNMTDLVDAGVAAILHFIQGVGDSALTLANGAADALIDFLEGLEDAIRTKGPRIREAGAGVADAIIDGMTDAIKDGASSVVDAISGMAGGAIDAAKGVLGINSPSKVFHDIGGNVVKGLVIGLSNTKAVKSAAGSLAKGVKSGFDQRLGELAVEGINPTITPVLDLTNVKMGANQINGMLSGTGISADVSLDNARLISAAATPPNDVAVAEAGGRGDVSFVQNIYSPKALSTADVYRNTNGQINRAKEELGIAS